jgi:calcium-dependent protein kinase
MLERPSSDAQIKLIDFGYATRHAKNDPPLTAFVGTAYATAPEVFKEEYNETCDLWPVGVVTFAMLCGQRPFVGKEVPNIANSKYRSMVADILSARYEWPRTCKSLTDRCKDFVSKLLTINTETRMTSKQALSHPFIAQVIDDEQFSETLTPLIPQIGAMSKFTELKKNAMMAVAFSMSQAEMEDLRDSFCTIDTDHSGTLTADEFGRAMRTVLPTIREEEIEGVFETIDQDGNGEISYLEFLAATMHKNNLSMKELKDAFNILDHDGSGYLEPMDFEALLGESDLNDKERIKTMLAEADTDGDGRVSFAEFVLAMGNVADLSVENEGVHLRPLDAVALQDEKRKDRLVKMNTFKRHKSDSALEIENMKVNDKELQSVDASPATHSISVKYRLKGQKSNEDERAATNETIIKGVTKQNMEQLSVAEINRAKIEMLRGSFSVSPSVMAQVKTPTFATNGGNSEYDNVPDSASSGGTLQEHASSPSSFNPVSFSPPATPLNKKVVRLSPPAGKLSPTNSGGGKLVGLPSVNEIENVLLLDGEQKSSDSQSNGMRKVSTGGIFSSTASLELLVLHKSQGSNNEQMGEEFGNQVEVADESKERTPPVGMDLESSLSAEYA